MGSGRAIARAARKVDEVMRTTMRTSNSEEAKDRFKHIYLTFVLRRVVQASQFLKCSFMLPYYHSLVALRHDPPSPTRLDRTFIALTLCGEPVHIYTLPSSVVSLRPASPIPVQDVPRLQDLQEARACSQPNLKSSGHPLPQPTSSHTPRTHSLRHRQPIGADIQFITDRQDEAYRYSRQSCRACVASLYLSMSQ